MPDHSAKYSCIIRGGSIVDGSGKCAPFAADVGIRGDRIAAVGDLSAARAPCEIDARGCLVSPGFVDVHVHGELALLGGRDRLAAVRQGVTTQLTSPDGFGWAPLSIDRAREFFRYTQFIYGDVELAFDPTTVERYLDTFRDRIPINLYPQVPHGAVRLGAMGWEPRPATENELAVMVDATQAWMDAGAGALCTGLDYLPSIYADLHELVTLSRVVADYGGIYAAHVRKQVLGSVGAWQETFEIAQRAGIPVHISHERVDGTTGPLLEQADREGVDLSFDLYLYPAGMTHLARLLPLDIQAGHPEEMFRRMRSQDARSRALPHLRHGLGASGDPIIGYTGSGRYVGMPLSRAAASAGKSREAFAYDLILEEHGVEASIIPWPLSEADSARVIEQTATHPRLMIASDGVYNIPHPHPRGYGCFARVLRQFVRQKKQLSWEQAVYRMSGFPARRFGLADRGQIAEGLAADLVVLDPDKVADRATWEHPLEPAVGIEWVLVNGEPVIARGAPTFKLPGRILKRSSSPTPSERRAPHAV